MDKPALASLTLQKPPIYSKQSQRLQKLLLSCKLEDKFPSLDPNIDLDAEDFFEKKVQPYSLWMWSTRMGFWCLRNGLFGERTLQSTTAPKVKTWAHAVPEAVLFQNHCSGSGQELAV